MTKKNQYDVIIIGGSYAGFSAAMALGRSMRDVLIIDSGHPCNWQTPHSHNFLLADGETPSAIAEKARQQVLAYPTLSIHNGLAIKAERTNQGFSVNTEEGQTFSAKKLLFATGVKDVMPPIDGFAECWGISVLHCPYCHGYEVRNEALGIIANGDAAFEMARMIHHWSKNLTLFTNGASVISTEQKATIESHNIRMEEQEIDSLSHTDGQLEHVVFADGTMVTIQALFARPAFEQHSTLPQTLGCEITEQGFVKADDFGRTTVAGVYAAGDCQSMLRAVSAAVASGTKAGAFINKELIEEAF